MYVVNGSDGRCLVAVRLIVGVRYLERPLREVLLYRVKLFSLNFLVVPISRNGMDWNGTDRNERNDTRKFARATCTFPRISVRSVF